MGHTDDHSAETIGSAFFGSTAGGGALTVGVMHDLGNFIQIASSAINLVANDPAVRASRLEEVVAGAKASLAQAGALVHQAMRAARLSNSEVEEIEPAACIAEIQSIVETAWDGATRLDVAMTADLPGVVCEPIAFKSAILNLLFNAKEAMPNGGVVSLTARRVRTDTGLDNLEIRVADTGIGMAPETMERAFEPYFTTKSGGLGGIGLPMVKHFVEEAGGRVSVSSRRGCGTEMRLEIPGARGFQKPKY